MHCFDFFGVPSFKSNTALGLHALEYFGFTTTLVVGAVRNGGFREAKDKAKAQAPP